MAISAAKRTHLLVGLVGLERERRVDVRRVGQTFSWDSSAKVSGQAEDGLDRKMKLLELEMPIAEPQCWLESAVPARERKQRLSSDSLGSLAAGAALALSGRGREPATIAHSFLSREEE